MFKKTIILSLVVFLCVSLFSCARHSATPPSDTTSQSYETLLEALEKKLAELQESYSDSNNDAKAEIERLKAEIEKIKNSSTSISTTAQTTVTAVPHIFRYKLNGGKAIITGFIGEEKSIIIPSIIDGFEVFGIDEKAFASSDIKSVVISDGIESIDWFAFSYCEDLSSITIPDSVKQIGYGAFDGVPKSFTIYCTSGSFAEYYAKSYGLAYAFI